MPVDMSQQELESALKVAKKVNTFEFRNEADEDDFIMASLYQDSKGHFRVIDQSGMNHDRPGEFEAGERLAEDEVESWTNF